MSTDEGAFASADVGEPAVAGGRVVGTFVKPARSHPVVPVGSLELVAGVGIIGDSNADTASDRQVLLVSEEVERDLGLVAGGLWENVTTSGVHVDSLAPGTELRIGPQAVLAVTGPCRPCALISRVTGITRPRLKGRRGTLGIVVSAGTVRPGDEVRIASAPEGRG